MNERIKELAEQAGVNLSSFQFSGTPIKYEVSESDLKKFAELIVQDCANFVREEYDHVDAEGIAWYMEIKYGLHGDYA